MVNTSDTASTLGRLRSLSHNFHIACEQVSTRAARVEAYTLVNGQMMATSTDPVGETAAHGKSGKSPCKGMTDGLAGHGVRMRLIK